MSNRRLLLTDAALQPVIPGSLLILGSRLITIGMLHAFIYIAAINQKKKTNFTDRTNCEFLTQQALFMRLNMKIFQSTVGRNVIGALNNL